MQFLLLVETLVLEDDNPATALLRYVSESGIKRLVLGSCFRSCIARYFYFYLVVNYCEAKL